MRAFALRVAAGLAAPVLALAIAVPALGADITYERQAEYERYSEPAPVYGPPVYGPPVYGPPVYAAPVYVPPRYVAPPPYAPYPYRPYVRVYRPPVAVPYGYPGYGYVAPRPPVPVYAAPRRVWSAPPQVLAEEEVVEAAPPYGAPTGPYRRW